MAGGGYSDVYRGALHDGTIIALKCLRVYDGPKAESKMLRVSLMGWWYEEHELMCFIVEKACRQGIVLLVQVKTPQRVTLTGIRYFPGRVVNGIRMGGEWKSSIISQT